MIAPGPGERRGVGPTCIRPARCTTGARLGSRSGGRATSARVTLASLNSVDDGIRVRPFLSLLVDLGAIDEDFLRSGDTHADPVPLHGDDGDPDVAVDDNLVPDFT